MGDTALVVEQSPTTPIKAPGGSNNNSTSNFSADVSDADGASVVSELSAAAAAATATTPAASTPDTTATTPATPVVAGAAALITPDQKKKVGDGDSSTHTEQTEEEDDDAAMIRRREEIRKRLREREARLTNLVRTTSTDSADSFIGQMRTVQETLRKIEDEKSELEKELNRLKNATDDDEFLKEKMNGIQEGFMKQVETIQKLEDELLAKKNEIDHLRDELVAKLRRIVELEFDLETHDVHYTDYSAEQFKLGEDALAEIKSMEKEMANGTAAATTEELLLNDPNASVSSMQHAGLTPASPSHNNSNNKLLAPRRAQKLISKLLADLDNLEIRYKEEKLQNAQKQEKAHHENEEYRTRIHILESQAGIRSKEDYDPSDGGDSHAYRSVDAMNEAWLRKRVETLEAKRSLYREEIKKHQKELEDMKREYKAEVRHAQYEVEKLTLENDAMKSRIRALETGIMEDDPAISQFAIIEKKIRECYNDIAKLEAANNIKDRQIATLKKDVTRLRMKEIASRGGQPLRPASNDDSKSNFSDLDAKLLNDHDRRMHQNDEDSASAAYCRDLQRQLQSAQQQLVKKDQELVIERAKAASTAAGLLARITELTGKNQQYYSSSQSVQHHHSSSNNAGSSSASTRSLDTTSSKDAGSVRGGRRKGKSTPLRFYL